MRKLALLLLLTSTLLFSQKKKKFDLDVVANIDAKMILMTAVGNNSFSTLVRPFFGFGFGGNLMTPINYGVGLDVNFLYSNVIYGEESRYGNIGSPSIISFDFFLTHRDYLSEDFFLEEMAGFTFYRQTNLYIDEKSAKNVNLGSGINLGAKLVYMMTEPQQVFLSAKLNTYKTNIYNENKDIEKFYNQSTFISFGLGYRYQF
ncbi:hypothetical protein [Chryseobacterium koreense]|uniref:Outer membrane protein beta-barrel domain-containing protein n=1 Tax=Chryseobacterium koreense CCUG 49689 TaxID=1304281 RepID=A0A0J7J204_9FLAO|nr:hypothetical protein [Chryseobacterium koreense]KMQ72081.1 hypothetical protein ACM44_03420 [Chryseobacterium koreense CCUG 49689]MBB5332042.1 hypothetical protein [Chryseobacterium koreense]